MFNKYSWEWFSFLWAIPQRHLFLDQKLSRYSHCHSNKYSLVWFDFFAQFCNGVIFFWVKNQADILILTVAVSKQLSKNSLSPWSPLLSCEMQNVKQRALRMTVMTATCASPLSVQHLPHRVPVPCGGHCTRQVFPQRHGNRGHEGGFQDHQWWRWASLIRVCWMWSFALIKKQSFFLFFSCLVVTA